MAKPRDYRNSVTLSTWTPASVVQTLDTVASTWELLAGPDPPTKLLNPTVMNRYIYVYGYISAPITLIEQVQRWIDIIYSHIMEKRSVVYIYIF